MMRHFSALVSIVPCLFSMISDSDIEYNMHSVKNRSKFNYFTLILNLRLFSRMFVLFICKRLGSFRLFTLSRAFNSRTTIHMATNEGQ